MPIEVVGGLRFHTQSLGSRGPRIVLLHGMFVGTLANWYFSVAPVLARDHRVLLYDLRGHGLSERTATGYSIASMAADLAGLLARFAGDEPVTIVGHSYGAIVALRFALDHPERVARLVIVEAPLPITKATTAEVLLNEARGERPEGGEVEITPEFVEQFVNEWWSRALRPLPPSKQEAYRGRGRRQRLLTTRALALVLDTVVLEELTQTPDIADSELAACRPPVLLCYGTRTFPVMTSTCARLAAVLPDACVRMFDSGHFLPREQPRALAEAIRSFVDG